MFKVGSGVAAVSDSAFGTDGVDRSFQLYDEHRLLRLLEDCGCSMIEDDESGNLGDCSISTTPSRCDIAPFG